ncbi:pyrroline-5-carboxylate reductase [Luteolibacter sp. AS25]|uniref:pyrroline-5-carboxylate reductase n=1 Tax=Luteolibacter sp. AS25 TaxID=3135776 RepID=UPI00398B7756
MKLGVIGSGKMATALVKGAITSGLIPKENVLGVARSQASRDRFTEATGAVSTSSLDEAVENCDVLLLGTKPQDVPTVLGEKIFKKAGGKLLISVAAGVTLDSLEKMTPSGLRVIRTMPNTPSLVGKGAAGFCRGSRATDEDCEATKALLSAVGLCTEVPEKLMDAVTGVSGSGPAYIYLIIEALADGGVKAGLPRVDALKLAAQTVSGAAEMVIQTGEHPAVLKDQVTSPGGTTIAGVAVLESKNVRSAMIEAVMASCNRAKELGKA